jgi:hypothetical protein
VTRAADGRVERADKSPGHRRRPPRTRQQVATSQLFMASLPRAADRVVLLIDAARCTAKLAAPKRGKSRPVQLHSY